MTDSAYNKAYYQRNKEKLLQQQKEYYYKHKETKALKRKETQRKSRLKNKDKIAQWNKQYYQKHKEEYYRRHLSYRYDLSPEDYIHLKHRAKGKCEICKRAFTATTKSHVDHNHDTGKVRGLLCHACNLHLEWYLKQGENARKYIEQV